MQKNGKQTAAHAAQDKGFYIILILCVAAIAISGYVLFFAPFSGGASMESVDYTPDVAQGNARIPTVTGGFPDEDTVGVILPDALPAETKQEEPPAEAKPDGETKSAQETTAQKPVWVQPVRGEVVQAWSGDQLVYHKTLGDWRVHEGVDYLATSGTRVYAVANGEVIEVTRDELWGTSVTIRLSDGRAATYRGLSDDPKVKTGSKVKAGDVIGAVAAVLPAEADIGAHVHFELRDKDGVSVDPAQGTGASAQEDAFVPSGQDVEE